MMNFTTHKCVALVVLALAASVAKPSLAVENHALLIGVSDYADARIIDLEGPENDVAALNNVLIEQWEYPASNITTLLNEQATEEGILRAIEQLESNSEAGDSLFVYFSGHGTSARDNTLGAQLHLPNGSGAIVAHDFDPEQFTGQNTIDHDNREDGVIVGRSDLRPLFDELDQSRTLFVVFDACFAGNSARGVNSEYTPHKKRFLSLNASRLTRGGDSAAAALSACTDCAAHIHNEYPYNNVVYFGASAEHELAVDISQAEIDAGVASTVDGKAHGAFTDALLRSLLASNHNSSGNSSDNSPDNSPDNSSDNSPGISSENNPGYGTDYGNEHTLTYRQLFQQVTRQFQSHCEACGHSPVMLPSSVLTELAVVDKPVFPGLHRKQVLAENPIEETLSDGKATVLVNENTLALAPWLAPVATRNITSLTKDSATLVLSARGNSIEARSIDGKLIAQLSDDSDDALHWVSVRQSLQQRLIDDKNNANELVLEMAHPLHGNEFYFGEKVTFSTRVNKPSRLLLLALDTAGDLHRLYPATEREWASTIPEDKVVTLPEAGADDLRVTEPAGTDEILFYALPENHPAWTKQSWAEFDNQIVDFEWLDTLVNQSPVRVSAAHRRLIAVAPE